METSPFMLILAPRSYPKVRIVLHSSGERREDVALRVPTLSLTSTPRAHVPNPPPVKVGIRVRNNCKATCQLLSEYSSNHVLSFTSRRREGA